MKPRIGWLPVLSALSLLLTAATAVQKANWIADLSGFHTLVVVGFALSVVLARTRLRSYLAWLILIIAGAGIAFTQVDDGEIFTRIGDWLDAIRRGSLTDETVPFALALLLMVWFCSALVGWTLLRHQQVLTALLLLSIGMGLNARFGVVSQWVIWLYAGLALWLLLATRANKLRLGWQEAGVTFGSEIRQRMRVIQLLLMVGLLGLSSRTADVESATVAQAFASWEPIQRVEVWLLKSLAGVNTPWQGLIGQSSTAQGLMPRAYLLGNAPTLQETVVMRVQVAYMGEIRPNTHWRAISYDVYTGRGWARSAEITQDLPANEPFPSTIQSTIPISQSVDWVYDDRQVRYTLGQPIQFDHATQLHVGQDGEAVWVESDRQRYQAVSLVSGATSAELNTITRAQITPAILAHYTQLPTIPNRLTELAQSLITPEMTPLQQAVAIETYLKQFPYSLDVSSAPIGRDPVDYFLFDLQSGYCDYYASAMVVLARSIGLPARLASGYIARNGAETVYQIDGHSWAEVYFGKYGWIEFEPTAGGVQTQTSSDADAQAVNPFVEDDFGLPDPSAPSASSESVQERASYRLATWLVVTGLMFMAVIATWLRLRRRPSLSEQVTLLHSAANRLNVASTPSQTPSEFQFAWGRRLARLWLSRRAVHWLRLEGWREEIGRYTTHITQAFAQSQYSLQKETDGVGSSAEWWRFRWLIFLLKWFGQE